MRTTMIGGLVVVIAAAAVSERFAAAAEKTKSAEPCTILFVDDEDVLYRSGTKKRILQFVKHSPDPVIAPELPWEGMLGWTSVRRDPASGRYQLWYQAYQPKPPQPPHKEDRRLRCVVCYAESADGIKWTKPKLKLFPYYDHSETNIVLIGAGDDEAGGYGDRYCNSVVFDERDPDPRRRYKMAYYDWHVGERANDGSGTHAAFSPDGIHWTKHGTMIVKTPFGGKGAQVPLADEGFYVEEQLKTGVVRKSWRVPLSMSDALDVFFDPRLQKFVGYGKMWIPGPDGGMAWKHAMGRVESEDFLTWSKPELVLAVDDRDPPHTEFHTSPVFLYNGQYLGLNQILDRGAGTIDAELISNRDGRRWDRTFANQWILARGPAEKFDAGSLLTNGTPVVLDDEIRFYYGAYRGTAVGGGGLDRQVPGSTDYHSGIGLAVARRDRFVGIGINPQAPAKGQKRGAPQLVNKIGQVTLKPLDFTGQTKLTVNADAGQGAARVEILNEDGYRMRGFTKDDALPLTTDGLRLEARWKEKSLADLPAGRYHVRVHLDQAELFALTLHP
jgi:hypothetical protein